MKKTIQKLSAFLLCLALLCSLAACGGTADKESTGSSSSDSSASTESKESSSQKEDSPEAADQNYRFTIYRSSVWPTYPADGGEGYQILKDAMKAYGLPNIDWEVICVSGTEYYDKLNVLAASESLPDLMDINQVTLTSFADQGLIMPLEDTLDQLPAIKDLMRDSEIGACTYNGHLYAYPVGYLEGAINGPNTEGLVIRQDWLDTLKLQVPTTIDDLYTVMKAFKEQDPDGNGQADTFGYIGTKTTVFDEIFGAYGIQPNFWMETPDGLRMGSTLPATKDALATLAKWYEEGLIDPDIFTTDGNLAQQKFSGSKGGVYEGSGFTGAPTQPEVAALLEITPEAALSAIPHVEGPDGVFGSQESAPGYGNIKSISTSCQNPDVLIKMLNWSVDEDPNGGFYLCSQGIEGQHFEINEDRTHITQLFDSFDDLYAMGLSNPVRFLQIVDRRWADPHCAEFFEAFSTSYRENKFWGTTPAMLDYPDTCANLFQEYLSKIVMGSLPVDAWDDYVEEFYSMGGTLIEEEVNAAYQEQQK